MAAAVLSYIPYLLAILAGPTWGDTGGEARYGAGWAILYDWAAAKAAIAASG